MKPTTTSLDKDLTITSVAAPSTTSLSNSVSPENVNKQLK